MKLYGLYEDTSTLHGTTEHVRRAGCSAEVVRPWSGPPLSVPPQPEQREEVGHIEAESRGRPSRRVFRVRVSVRVRVRVSVRVRGRGRVRVIRVPVPEQPVARHNLVAKEELW